LPIFQRTNPVIRKVYPLSIKFLWITTKIGEEPILLKRGQKIHKNSPPLKGKRLNKKEERERETIHSLWMA